MAETHSNRPHSVDDRPLVLVPGFMASNLWRPSRLLLTPPFLVWPLNLYSLTVQLFLLRENSKLEADGLVGHYYDELIDFVIRPPAQAGLGKVRGGNFWIFAYDWRQSCEISGKQLADFIANKLERANTRRRTQGLSPWQSVDIINHSMGGFVTRAAQRLYSAPINRVVYIASGHYGIAKAYFALHPDTVTSLIDEFIKDFIPGWYWDLLKTFPNIVLLEEWLVQLLTRYQSVYELLPDDFYLTEPNSVIIDTTRHPPHPITGAEETYFRHPWQFPLAQQGRIRKALEFKEKLGSDLPGQHNLVIYSASLPTYAYADYSSHLEHPHKLAVGDLTVTAPSASYDERATRVEVDGVHSRLPNLKATHEAIYSFLR